MSLSVFGSASSVADNGTATGDTVTVTPPSSMAAGDLVLVFLHKRETGGSAKLYPDTTNTGGQVWHRLTEAPATNVAAVVYGCIFNGTWTADPVFRANTTTVAATAVMHVIRSDQIGSGKRIDLDVYPVAGTFTAGTTPFTKTISAITTRNNGAMVIAAWFSVDDNTWGSLTGSVGTWTTLGSAQYRNLQGTDQSSTYAYQVIATAGTSGTVSVNQATLGGDAGSTLILSVYEATVPSTSVPTVEAFTDGEDSTDGTTMTATILGNGTHGSLGTWGDNGTTPGTKYKVSTAAEKALGRSVTVGATTYDDTSATRGMQIDYTNGTQTERYLYTFGASKALLSTGFFVKTDLPLGDFESYTINGIEDGGGAGLVALNIQTTPADVADTGVNDKYAVYLENGAFNTFRGPDLSTLTWYWVTLRYDQANNRGSLQVWDPSTWTQIGLTVTAVLGSGVGNADHVMWGQHGGGFPTKTGNSIWLDDLIIDDGGLYPLLPGVPAGSSPAFRVSLLGAGR